MRAAEDPLNAGISIPAPLLKRIEERIIGPVFASVRSNVVYVLRALMGKEDGKGQALGPEDEERVKQRLRALGYFD